MSGFSECSESVAIYFSSSGVQRKSWKDNVLPSGLSVTEVDFSFKGNLIFELSKMVSCKI